MTPEVRKMSGWFGFKRQVDYANDEDILEEDADDMWDLTEFTGKIE